MRATFVRRVVFAVLALDERRLATAFDAGLAALLFVHLTSLWHASESCRGALPALCAIPGASAK